MPCVTGEAYNAWAMQMQYITLILTLLYHHCKFFSKHGNISLNTKYQMIKYGRK